jgi:hypothetical protein
MDDDDVSSSSIETSVEVAENVSFGHFKADDSLNDANKYTGFLDCFD